VLEQLGAQHVLLVGPAFLKTTGPKHYHYHEKTAQALAFLSDQNLRGCTILLKGSRGMKLETLLEVL